MNLARDSAESVDRNTYKRPGNFIKSKEKTGRTRNILNLDAIEILIINHPRLSGLSTWDSENSSKKLLAHNRNLWTVNCKTELGLNMLNILNYRILDNLSEGEV